MQTTFVEHNTLRFASESEESNDVYCDNKVANKKFQHDWTKHVGIDTYLLGKKRKEKISTLDGFVLHIFHPPTN